MTSIPLEVFSALASKHVFSATVLSAASEYVRSRDRLSVPLYTAQILDDAFINGIGMKAMEKKYGWSKGAAKNVLRVLLITAFCDEGTPEPVEAYEPVEDPDDLGALMTHYRFTGYEAAVFSILHERRNRPVSRDAINERVYGIDVPESDTLGKMVMGLRRKLAVMRYNGTIETVRGYGYVLQTMSARPTASLLPNTE